MPRSPTKRKSGKPYSGKDISFTFSKVPVEKPRYEKQVSVKTEKTTEEKPVEESFGPHCKNFVERTFMSARTINLQTLLKYADKSDIFLIYKDDGVLKEKDLLELKIPKNEIKTLGGNKTCVVANDIRFVIGDPARINAVMIENKKPVHVVVYRKDRLLYWEKSSLGYALKHLKPYIQGNNYTEYKISYNDPVTIIYGDYGMGKSEVLYQISRGIIQSDRTAIIKMIDYRNLQKFIETGSLTTTGSLTINNFMQFFKISKDVNTHIMIDNVEETDSYKRLLRILSNLPSKHQKYIKMWFTCSTDLVKEHLENTFATLCCILTPLTESQQIRYLTDCFSGNKKESDPKLFPYIIRIIVECNKFYWKKFIKNKTLGYTFTSYPLHLRMIAEVCHPSDINNEHIYNAAIPDLLEIYNSYVKTSNAEEEENLQKLAVQELYQICENVPKYKRMNEELKKYLENRYLVEYIVAVHARDNINVYKDVLNIGCTSWFFFHIFNRNVCVLNDLHNAVMNDDVNYIEENVDDENIMETDEFGRTLLHFAVSTEMINTLIKKGINVDIRDKIFSWSALNYFDYRTFLSGVEVMLSNFADSKDLNFIIKKATSEEKSKRLSTALALNLEHTVFQLLSLKDEKIIDGTKKVNKIVINAKNVYEAIKYLRPACAFSFVTMISTKKYANFKNQNIMHDALRVAIERFCNEAFIYLIQNVQCDYLVEYPDGMSLFRYACKYINMELVEFLDTIRRRNNKEGWALEPVLEDCCKTDNIRVLTYLFDNHEIDIAKPLPIGKTPLELACLHKSSKVASKLFCNTVGNVSTTSLLTYEMLANAVSCPCYELMYFILKMKKDLNVNEKTNFPLIHMACRQESTDPLLLLLEYKADVNLLNEMKQTPLFDAHYSKNIDVIKILIKNKCDVNHTDKNGENVLHHYIKVFQDIYLDSLRNMIKLLVDEGANIYQTCDSGKTPLSLAEELNTTSIYELLITSRQHKTEYRAPVLIEKS